MVSYWKDMPEYDRGIMVGSLIAYIMLLFFATIGNLVEDESDYIRILNENGWVSYPFDNCECLYAPNGEFAIRIEVVD